MLITLKIVFRKTMPNCVSVTGVKKIVLILLIFSFIGCDIFKTRTPENPVQVRTKWTPTTTVDILIDNLKSSLNEKSTENYLRCLIDSITTNRNFVFIPASESYAIYPNLFMNWGVLNERIYFENVKSRLKENSGMTLSLYNEERGTVQGDSLIYAADYQLLVDHSLEDMPKKFEGHLQFTLFRDFKGEWAIITWKDMKKNESKTWSDLKGRFSY